MVEDYASHPVRRLFDAGVPVCVNTDDPMMFGTTMVDELAGLMEVHGFSFDELVRTLEYAIDASWADAETKAMLRSAQAAEVAPRDANRSK